MTGVELLVGAVLAVVGTGLVVGLPLALLLSGEDGDGSPDADGGRAE